MIRFEANLDGTIAQGEPFTDFNELEELRKIFDSLDLQNTLIRKGDGGYYLFQLRFPNGKIYKFHIYLKKITFGGRASLPYEKRAQFSASIDRTGYLISENETEDEFSLILGIYKNENFSDVVVCAWDIHEWGYNFGRAFNCFVNVKSIALAYKNNFSQHKSSRGQIVCCFRPHDFLYYLDNRKELHKILVNKATEKRPIFISLDSYTDSIPNYKSLFQIIINILKDYNGIANVNTIEKDAARILKLTEKAKLLIHNPNEGYRTELGYQLAWSRLYLKKAGYIENLQRGVWGLTEEGWNALINIKEIVKKATEKEIQKEIDYEFFHIEDSENEIEEEIDIAELEITNPFDPNKVDIRTRTMSLDLILKRLKTDAINMNTSFQRNANLWNVTKQSRLIESILVKFPLPAFYFDGSNDDNWLVVDGLQRLSSLDNFVNKEAFTLRNLEFLEQFNEYTFRKLPSYLQRRIEEFEITAYIIAAGTPKQLKFNVFKRINTGGLPLTTQEIRNALFQGKGIEFLKRITQLKSFKMATSYSIPEDRLQDQEFANRFLAFYLFGNAKYNSDLDGYLNKALEEINLNLEINLEEIEENFDRAMKASYKIFAEDAFRKRYNIEDKRKPINKALFEVWAVLLSKLNETQTEVLIRKKNDLKNRFINLLNEDEVFNKAITSGTGEKSRVRKRFGEINRIIEFTISE